MKRHVVTIVAAALLIAADVPPPSVEKTDEASLQGAWRLVYGMQDGSEWPSEEVRRVRMEVRGDEFQVWHGGSLVTGPLSRVKLDATTTPKAIESTVTGGGVSLVYQGIYEVAGDKYRVSFAMPGEPRPTDFSCAPGSGRRLQVWRRASAP